MPQPLTYPGVYIEEVSSGVRTIVGVATSRTVFIGRTVRGPQDKPVRVQGQGEFERNFGPQDLACTLPDAVKAFFEHGGSDAVIVRERRSRDTFENAGTVPVAVGQPHPGGFMLSPSMLELPVSLISPAVVTAALAWMDG